MSARFGAGQVRNPGVSERNSRGVWGCEIRTPRTFPSPSPSGAGPEGGGRGALVRPREQTAAGGSGRRLDSSLSISRPSRASTAHALPANAALPPQLPLKATPVPEATPGCAAAERTGATCRRGGRCAGRAGLPPAAGGSPRPGMTATLLYLQSPSPETALKARPGSFPAPQTPLAGAAGPWAPSLLRPPVRPHPTRITSTKTPFPDEVTSPAWGCEFECTLVNSLEPLMFPPPGNLPQPPGPATVLRAGHLGCRGVCTGLASPCPALGRGVTASSFSKLTLCLVACRILVPLAGIEPRALWYWKHRVLSAGPPGNSPVLHHSYVAGMGPAPGGYSNCNKIFFPLLLRHPHGCLDLDYFRCNSGFTG